MTALKLSAMTLICLVLVGCQTIQEKQPTIAHTHIGHALTAWPTTPDKIGLFVTAENEARALNRVLSVITANSSLQQMKAAARDASLVIKPSENGTGPGEGFGLQRAFDEAMSHLQFAVSSTDTSANFRQSIARISPFAAAVRDRIELVGLLAQDVQGAQAVSDASPLISEMQTVSREIFIGAESDGKPQIGSSPEEAGLRQLRNEIAAMTARENPPYVPVSERWLFGLIRLPSGEWKFDFSNENDFGESEGGDGGGGY